MSGFVETGVACIVASVLTSVQATPTGWTEELRYDINSAGGCQQIVLHASPGTRSEITRAKLRLGDDTRRKLGPERFETLPPRANGHTRLLVHLDDMVSGDSLRLWVTRSWDTAEPYRWAPGRDGASWAELSTSREAEVEVFGAVRAESRGDGAWVESAGPEDLAVVASTNPMPSQQPAQTSRSGLGLDEALAILAPVVLVPRHLDGAQPVSGDAAMGRGWMDDRGWASTLAALTAGGPDAGQVRSRAANTATSDQVWPQVVFETAGKENSGPVGAPEPSASLQGQPLLLNREITLEWPADPAYSLFPGRGSSMLVEDTVEVPAERAAFAILPTDPRAHSVEVEGDGVTVRETPGALLIAFDRGEQREVVLRWSRPDAPTFGSRLEAPGWEVSQQVRAEGRIRWEGLDWSLRNAGETPILPNREPLLRALEYRFAILSYPAPALPQTLRDRGASWDSAADLPAGLRLRTEPSRLSMAPLWPRKLLQARRSGVVSPLEAAIFTSQWAREMDMQASWVLVKPASRGDGAMVSPAGYSDALVRIAHDNELRWLDPWCAMCAPFELRPDMEGASAYGWEVARTPDPTPGSATFTPLEGGYRVELQASAALDLRLTLDNPLVASRSEALLAHLFTDASKVSVLEGLEKRGQAVQVEVVGGEPRLWPEADQDGTTWMPWVGTRTVLAASGPPARWHGQTVEWERKVTDEGTVEVLTVMQRRIPAAEREAVAAAREALAIPVEPATAEDAAEDPAEPDESGSSESQP